jgi:hypothetical protein
MPPDGSWEIATRAVRDCRTALLTADLTALSNMECCLGAAIRKVRTASANHIDNAPLQELRGDLDRARALCSAGAAFHAGWAVRLVHADYHPESFGAEVRLPRLTVRA